MADDAGLRIPIAGDDDIVTARQQAKQLAAQLRFSSSDLTVIAAAISEVARNIVTYAGRGEVRVCLVERAGRRGITVVARDDGPGIDDVETALKDGFSTSGNLGLGLPGARRLMDEFEIDSVVGSGTTVTMRKWTR